MNTQKFAVFLNWNNERAVVTKKVAQFPTYEEAAQYAQSRNLGSTLKEERWLNIEKIWTDAT